LLRYARNDGIDHRGLDFMHRSLPMLALLATALWSAPAPAQQRSQLGPLCTTDTTPADQQIDACNKILALKVFSGEKPATIYFWRAVGWNKKGNYSQVIADASEALRLKPDTALYNLRGSAYYDKGEYDIAIADFNPIGGHRATVALEFSHPGSGCRLAPCLRQINPSGKISLNTSGKSLLGLTPSCS
jgi:hypothetical protein